MSWYSSIPLLLMSLLACPEKDAPPAPPPGFDQNPADEDPNDGDPTDIDDRNEPTEPQDPGEEEPGPIEHTSALCPEISGLEAAAWDYYNGVPLTDPAIVPPPFPQGGLYIHPDWPLLGFSHPAGWTAYDWRGQGVVGVDLVRDDETALWRYLSTPLEGIPAATDILLAELDWLDGIFGSQGARQVICERTASGDLGTGTLTTIATALVRRGGHTALVSASVTPYVGGAPFSSLYLRVMSAPTVEFPQRAHDTFLAIDWQLLVGPPEEDPLHRFDPLQALDPHPDALEYTLQAPW